MDKPKFLTIPQAYEYFELSKLGFSEKRLYRIWKNIRGFFKIGGSVLADREMVEDYFKELASTVKPTARKSGREPDRDSNRHGLLP